LSSVCLNKVGSRLEKQSVRGRQFPFLPRLQRTLAQPENQGRA
jgi:hypothetical protein